MLHLIKIAVGIESIEHLVQVQARRRKANRRLFHVTRHRPRRAEEVLAGGSIYWIIRGYVRVRQPILGFVDAHSPERGPIVRILLDPALVATRLQPRRPHQGWRYYLPNEAPSDLPNDIVPEQEPPPEMAAELRALGLI
jgi:hypothetical protein